MRGRESDGFCASLHRMQRIEVASHPGLRGAREKSGFGAFHPARMLNITSKLPRLLHVRLPSVFLSPCQGWVSFTLSALFTD